MTSRDWTRLAHAVADRRAELGKTQPQLAQDCGISLDTVQAIEKARRTTYRRTTLRKLEHGLEWLLGSVDTVMAGGDPVPLPRSGPPGVPTNDDLIAVARAKLAELRGELDRLGEENSGTKDALLDGIDAWIDDATRRRR